MIWSEEWAKDSQVGYFKLHRQQRKLPGGVDIVAKS